MASDTFEIPVAALSDRAFSAGLTSSSHGEVRLRLSSRRAADDLRNLGKRSIDVVLSLILLLLAAPLFVAIAVAVKLESQGPVFFVQERAGSKRVTQRREAWWELRSFRCYKFRSMVSDADESAHLIHIKRFVGGSIEVGSPDQPTFKISGDDRITRVGRLLRKTSLDEIPQLVNVLKGDMSLVGPRPVPLYEVAEYEPWHYERLAALPGVTGVWQVYGRGRATFNEMVQMDIDYVRRRTLKDDMKLLVATLPAVLEAKGAA